MIDGESVDLHLALHPDGGVREISMRRYGNVGTPDWDLIPYGFATESESEFGGYTIPPRVRGGWWYGTDRYDPRARVSSTFTTPASGDPGNPSLWLQPAAPMTDIDAGR
jgi:hypothetical protein